MNIRSELWTVHARLYQAHRPLDPFAMVLWGIRRVEVPFEVDGA